MHSDAAARTGQRGFRRRGSPCHCGPPYPGGPGHYPPPGPSPATSSDHPAPRGDAHSPSRSELEGRGFGLSEKVDISGHRNPQRKPVFAGLGPYAHADDFSQSYPWDLNPAHWRYPGLRDAGPRHYPPVQLEQCGGCVIRGVAATRPFEARHVPQWAPLPVQFKGQTRPRHVNYRPEPEHCWGCGVGPEHYRLETRAPEQSYLHAPKPNGHCGQWPDYSQGGVDGDYHLDWSRRRGGSEGGCNGRRPSHQAFFSTEVPQRDLYHPRRRTPPTRDPGPDYSSQCKAPVAPRGSDPERPKGGAETVREQIRQVVIDLEGVLGGLKQVHVEMKEVVQQIDCLTANIDLGEEESNPSLPSDSAQPWGLAGLQVYSPKAPGEQAPQRQHSDTADHVILRTNSPSPVHMAAVVKTSQVVPPGPSKDPHRDRRGVNGHPPHLCPPRDANHVAPSDMSPPPLAVDPIVVVGNSTSYSRSQKPPPYPHNGRAERGSKGPAPPRTPLYPAGKCRQSSSLV